MRESIERCHRPGRKHRPNMYTQVQIRADELARLRRIVRAARMYLNAGADAKTEKILREAGA